MKACSARRAYRRMGNDDAANGPVEMTKSVNDLVITVAMRAVRNYRFRPSTPPLSFASRFSRPL
jgi:hypothetical protein